MLPAQEGLSPELPHWPELASLTEWAPVWPCGPLDMPRDFERVTARGPSLRSCPLASSPCLPRLFTPSGFRKVPVGRAICSLLQCH